ncbi:MAG: hypothetical protein AAFO69_03180 [Bacteroidota bacterium]
MQKFFRNIILFSILVVVVDYAVYTFFQYQRPVDYKLFIESKTDFFANDQQQDLLIIGDSHIANSTDPQTIERATGLSGFNLGVYHSSPFESYAMLKNALKKNIDRPKIVLIGTNPVMFHRELSKGRYTPIIIDDLRISAELAYQSVEGIDATFFLKSMRERYLIEHLISKATGKKYVPRREVVSYEDGFLKYSNHIDESTWENPETIYNLHHSFNLDQVMYFEKTIQLLKNKGIQVIVVNSPIWYENLEKLEKQSEFQKFSYSLNAICSTYKVPIFNRDHRVGEGTIGLNDFLDGEHLNFNGAVKFSIALSDFIVSEGYDE